MEHKDFESPSYLKFKEFHIELNHYIKLSIASIDHLLESADSPGFEDRVNNLVRNAKERWYGLRIMDPVGELKKLRVQLTKTGVVWVYSAFDVFLNHADGVCSQKLDKELLEVAGSGTQAEELEVRRINKLYSKYGWSLAEINYLIPLYNYYSLARHCISHNMGKANSELINLSKSAAFLDAMETWPTVNPDAKLSPPPIIDSAGTMTLSPHHAITYSDVCYRISKDINRHILEHLGIEYFIKETVKDNIQDAQTLNGQWCKDVYRYIRHRIKLEWKLDGASDTQIKQILEDMGTRKSVIIKYNILAKKART